MLKFLIRSERIVIILLLSFLLEENNSKITNVWTAARLLYLHWIYELPTVISHLHENAEVIMKLQVKENSIYWSLN